MEEWENIFEYVEVQSSYIKNLLKKTLERISKKICLDEILFAPIHERSVTYVGCVTEDGDIFLDSDKLKNYPDEIAQALIAHELAHHFLKHHIDKRCSETLDCENEADNLAKNWGFMISDFRKIFGPASMQE